jgi:hypothetical protein
MSQTDVTWGLTPKYAPQATSVSDIGRSAPHNHAGSLSSQAMTGV